MIDLSTVDDEQMSENERRQHNASISAVFPRLERDLKRWMYDQLMHNSQESLNWEQVLAGRGVYAGFEAMLNHWERCHMAHMERSVPDNFDENSPLGEV